MVRSWLVLRIITGWFCYGGRMMSDFVARRGSRSCMASDASETLNPALFARRLVLGLTLHFKQQLQLGRAVEVDVRARAFRDGNPT